MDGARGGPRSTVDYGARIRALRRSRGLTLQQVAGTIGISASALSQIERGITAPTVQRLPLIAKALGAELGALFVTETESSARQDLGVIVRRANDPAMMSLSKGVTYRRLTASPIPDVEVFESVWEPGAASGEPDEFMTHTGTEGGAVSEGQLVVGFETGEVVLSPGDSITFDSSLPHRLFNPRLDQKTVATWVLHRRGPI